MEPAHKTTQVSKETEKVLEAKSYSYSFLEEVKEMEKRETIIFKMREHVYFFQNPIKET